MTNWLIGRSPVPVSKPVLSVVGGTLVLGKPFQLLCHSDSGTLPIMYTLFSPNRVVESMEVSHPGQQAIFNTSAVNKRSDVDTFLCHARNSPQGTTVTETGQLLRSTKIIGVFDAGMMTTHSSKLMLTWSNIYFLHRACVKTSVEHTPQHGGRVWGAGCDSGLLRSERHSSHHLHLVPHWDRRSYSHFQDLWENGIILQDQQCERKPPRAILLCLHQSGKRNRKKCHCHNQRCVFFRLIRRPVSADFNSTFAWLLPKNCCLCVPRHLYPIDI